MINILWITYSPIGHMSELFIGKRTQSGTWVDAMAELLNTHDEITLSVAAPYQESKVVRDNGVTYYGVPNCKRIRGAKTKTNEFNSWNNVIKQISPDIIILWGTEYANGVDIVNVAKACSIPCLIFIQGVVKAIAVHGNGDLKYSTMLSGASLIDGVKTFILKIRERDLINQCKYEEEIINKSSGILCDSDWCSAQYLSIKNDLPIYNVSLPIGTPFVSGRWTFNACHRNTLFCIAGTGPLKGLHHLIKAISIVKTTIPNIRLIIPGDVVRKKPYWLYQNPYMSYVYRLIKKNNLGNNIIFCGRLTPEQMAEKMLESNAFIMMSCIENHSSTLREAMYLGVPCISSAISSVPEFVTHGKNGFLYRYCDDETLAYYIKKILCDYSLAKSVSDNAYVSIRDKYPQKQIADKLIYAIKMALSNNSNS